MKDECNVRNSHDDPSIEPTEELLKSYLNRIGDDIANKRLIISDVLYGGRTENLVYYFLPADGSDKICYLDFTSLYFWVQKTQEFPVGIPKKPLGDKIPSIPNFVEGVKSKEYFGVAYVTVLPPRELYIPVLSGRYNGKLVFTLCRTCAKEGSEKLCEHTERQREITGVYTTPELELVDRKGYKNSKLYEIWNFESMVGLFTEYVKAFMKWKTEASDLPDGITSLTNPELDNFIIEFERREGVKLEKEKIISNLGLRSIAKLCLNSIWGETS